MSKKKRLYYSHSKLIYNSDLEKHEFKLIKKRFPDNKIINPNGDIDYQSMINCYWTIDDTDILVFSTIDDLVGKGVYTEIEYAEKGGKKIYWLRGNRFYRKYVLYINDPDSWRFGYGIVGLD